jgi:protein tyrosine/serine phosphatase
MTYSGPSSLRKRNIEFEGLKNIRDLGGIAGMPRGILFRSADLLEATAADKARIKNELKLQTVIDLRTDVEVDMKGCGDLGVAQRLLCDLPPNAKVVAKTTGARVQKGYAQGPPGMAESNELLLDVGRESFKKAFRAIAKPGGLPALFHCSSGKDRTGLLAMLLLSFVGASDDDIAIDYALTSEFLPEPPDAIQRAQQQFTRFTGVEIGENQARNVLASEPQSAHLTLAMVRRVHGSVESYMRKQLEFSDAEIVALRKTLTTPLQVSVQPATLTSSPSISCGKLVAAAVAAYVVYSNLPDNSVENSKQVYDAAAADKERHVAKRGPAHAATGDGDQYGNGGPVENLRSKL